MKKYWKIVLIFFVAFVFRLLLIPIAYHGDLNNNISWGNKAVEIGFNNYYEHKQWEYSSPNQPPLTIFLFSLTSFVWKSVEDLSWKLNNSVSFFPSKFIWFWESKGMVYLVKLPSVVADLLIGGLIYKFIAQKKNKSLALKISALWLFNPVIWYNSALWGQTDPIVNFLGLVAILALLDKRLIRFSVFYVLSLLFKGSLTIFAPILLVVVFLQNYPVRDYLKALLVSVMTVVVSTVWFHPQIDLFVWLFNLYTQRIFPGEIGFLTANTFNFWWLVDSGRTLDSTVYFGLPARIWGFVLSFAVILATLGKLMKSGLSKENVMYSLAMVALTTFLFMTRIHERYLYPFFPWATLLVGLMPGFLVYYILISLAHLINLYHLFWAPSMPMLENAFIQNPIIATILSWFNLLLFVLILRHFLAKRI